MEIRARVGWAQREKRSLGPIAEGPVECRRVEDFGVDKVVLRPRAGPLKQVRRIRVVWSRSSVAVAVGFGFGWHGPPNKIAKRHLSSIPRSRMMLFSASQL
jgi:hypothetical protein